MAPEIPSDFHIFPVEASKIAGDVDAFYLFMVAISAFFCIAIPAAIIYFAVKYRRRPGNEHGRRVETSKFLEITWTVIPFFIVMGMFFWGSRVYFEHATPNPNAVEILTTGKKWMWKFQHKNGRREINDLHLPVNTPIRLKMASEDVIHSVFIPAFRQKQDVMPGRFSYLNITPTRPGVYHLFCNQYCGTQHSNMIGKVVVMAEGDYQKWLGGFTGDPPEKVGEQLFSSLACNTCHTGGSDARGPMLNGLLGSKVGLQGGNVIVADDTYVRESILNPQAKVVAGFQPIMPSFQGVVSQDQINALIAYIKTLPAKEQSAAPAATSAQADTQTPNSAVVVPTAPENPRNPQTNTAAPTNQESSISSATLNTSSSDADTTAGKSADGQTTDGAGRLPLGQQLGVQ